MKDEDYEKNIDIYDAELDRLNDLLMQYDPLSDEYQKLILTISRVEDLKGDAIDAQKEHNEMKRKAREVELQEEKLAWDKQFHEEEAKRKSRELELEAERVKMEQQLHTLRLEAERRNGMVPDWAPKVAAIAVNAMLVAMIYHGEFKGAVIGSASTSLLAKVKIF